MESAEVLCRYIKAKDDILVIGSGNSELSAEMYYTGLRKITVRYFLNINLIFSKRTRVRKVNYSTVCYLSLRFVEY